MQPSYEDVCLEVTRLKRRLERERNARIEAEAIAETGLRNLYEKQQQVQLLEKIATAANRTATADEILQFAMAEVCAFTGWEVAHCYLSSKSAGAVCLRSALIWHMAEPGRLEEFRRVTEEAEFSTGVGLPGRVLASGKPLWLGDLTDERNFPRLPFALKCGLRGASAFPVLLGDEVVAVIEFFSSVKREPNETILYLMSQIGTQLGRVIERQRAETRLRERARELMHARDAAKAADDAKSAFLAAMSHELRTPLNAIIGFSELIRDADLGPLDAQYRDFATDINQSGRHLQTIIDDILDISKIEVGHMELREDIVSIGETAEACGRIVSAMANSAGVSLSIEIPDTLPPVRSDPMRFQQILLNLMSNAVKFTPSGGRVRVSAGIEADGLVVAVADTGIGMKAEDIAVAIAPFRQVDSALSRRFDGTGLGLPLAKALVELHGGRLEIDSAPGMGTTVRIRLPLDRLLSAAA